MSETGPQDSDIHFTSPPIKPDYSLDKETLDAIEQRMVSEARQVSDDSIVVAWIDPSHEYANFLRTRELQKFPEVEPYYEQHQLYFALVDTRGEGGVVHAATLMEYDDSASTEGPESPTDLTGFYTIDSLIELGNFTKAEFVDYYRGRGIDLSQCLSVETNFKIVDDVEPYAGMAMADLAYLTMINLFESRSVPRDKTILFASINVQQAKSLERNNFEFEPLLGRTDFHTEESDLGKVSNPVALYLSQEGYAFIASLNFRLPEIHYDAEKQQ
jgi:hypothetical protein